MIPADIARDCGLEIRTPHGGPMEPDDEWHEPGRDGISVAALWRFAAALRAKVLEEAATAAEAEALFDATGTDGDEAYGLAITLCAAAIRALKSAP